MLRPTLLHTRRRPCGRMFVRSVGFAIGRCGQVMDAAHGDATAEGDDPG